MQKEPSCANLDKNVMISSLKRRERQQQRQVYGGDFTQPDFLFSFSAFLKISNTPRNPGRVRFFLRYIRLGCSFLTNLAGFFPGSLRGKEKKIPAENPARLPGKNPARFVRNSQPSLRTPYMSQITNSHLLLLCHLTDF